MQSILACCGSLNAKTLAPAKLSRKWDWLMVNDSLISPLQRRKLINRSTIVTCPESKPFSRPNDDQSKPF